MIRVPMLEALLRAVGLRAKPVPRRTFARGECRWCGKRLAVTKAGDVWTHKCQPAKSEEGMAS